MALTSEEIAKIQEEECIRAQEREKYASVQNTNTNQKYGFPAFLSFFIPGLGQIVKGEIVKGFLVFMFFVIGFIFVLRNAGMITFCFFMIIAEIIIWIWQLIDAYNYNNQS